MTQHKHMPGGPNEIRRAFLLAAGRGDADEMERLLPWAAPQDRETALRYVTTFDHRAALLVLLQAGVDPLSLGDALQTCSRTAYAIIYPFLPADDDPPPICADPCQPDFFD